MNEETSKHTRRYQKTDKKLLSSACKVSSSPRKTRITVKELAYWAGVNVSTFYRHFRSLLDFSRHHEKMIRDASSCLLDELTIKGPTLEALFFRISSMVYNNRASVRYLFTIKNDLAIRQIFWIFRPLISREWSSYGWHSDQRIYCFFVAEATEVIRLWMFDCGFQRSHIDIVTRQLVFIAKKTAPSLAPMVKMDERTSSLPKNYR